MLGSKQPGETNTIRNGPSARGAFIWADGFIFRDDDPTVYLRIIDDTGATIRQAKRGVTPELTLASTPTPDASPPAGVPNGGGFGSST